MSADASARAGLVVHLNGWPGVGKLTIGRALAERLNARLIDNHLLHDAAIACAGLDDPQRWPRKLTDPALLRDFIARDTIQRPDVPKLLILDVTELSAEQAAACICRHLAWVGADLPPAGDRHRNLR